MSTSALSATEQTQILTRPRPRQLPVDHPILGRVIIRDQAPLRARILEKALQDMSVTEWVGALNERVFFWLDPRRLGQLLAARDNRARPHDVLTIDTASLVGRYHDRIRLSAINSGATLFPNAAQRGSFTFRAIKDYPSGERQGRHPAIAELTIIGGVPDIADHVTGVERRPAAAAQPV